LRKHQNTENFFGNQNGKGLIPPKSFAVPIIVEDSFVPGFVNPMLAPVLAHILLSCRAYGDISK